MLLYPLLTVPPSFLYPLPLLISNCLNLLFTTKGRSRRLTNAYFLNIINEDTERMCTQEVSMGPAPFHKSHLRHAGTFPSG